MTLTSLIDTHTSAITEFNRVLKHNEQSEKPAKLDENGPGDVWYASVVAILSHDLCGDRLVKQAYIATQSDILGVLIDEYEPK